MCPKLNHMLYSRVYYIEQYDQTTDNIHISKYPDKIYEIYMPTLSSPYQTTEVHFSLEWFCPDNLLTKHKFYWINNDIFLVYAKNEEKIGNPMIRKCLLDLLP